MVDNISHPKTWPEMTEICLDRNTRALDALSSIAEVCNDYVSGCQPFSLPWLFAVTFVAYMLFPGVCVVACSTCPSPGTDAQTEMIFAQDPHS